MLDVARAPHRDSLAAAVLVFYCAAVNAQTVTYNATDGRLLLDTGDRNLVALFVSGPDLTDPSACTLCDGDTLPSSSGDQTFAAGYSVDQAQWLRTAPISGDGPAGYFTLAGTNSGLSSNDFPAVIPGDAKLWSFMLVDDAANRFFGNVTIIDDNTPGESCTNPIPIGGLPFSDTGDTRAFANNYAALCGLEGSAPDVVYEFTPAEDGEIDILLCGSSYDTRVFVFQDDCDGTDIACNDDECGFQSALYGLIVSAGRTYFVVVDGWGTSSFRAGEYELIVREAIDQPANEACPTAEVISPPFAATVELNRATADGPRGSCNNLGSGPTRNDIWFTWTATLDCEATVSIDNQLQYDAVTVIYEGADCGSLAEFRCTTEGITDVTWNAVAGTTYYIQHGAAGDAPVSGTVNLALDISDGGVTCPWTPFESRKWPALRFPRTTRSADLDGDGDTDLVVGDLSRSALMVLLLRPDGSFDTHYVDGVEDSSLYLEIDDYNADGILDLVASGTLRVVVALGNGDGTFQSAVQVETSREMLALRVGQQINATFPSVAIKGSQDSLRVCSRFDSGDALSCLPTGWTIGLFGVESPVVGDFNGDSFLDLALLADDFQIFLTSLGNPLGFYQETRPFLSGDIDGLEPGFVDGDDQIDLIVVGDGIRVLSHSFGTVFNEPIATPFDGRLSAVDSALINGDDFLDVVVVDRIDQSLHVVSGNGDGTFDPTPIQSHRLGSSPASVAVGDFDGDGLIDAATPNGSSGDISVILDVLSASNNSTQTLPLLGGAAAVNVADLNQDGILDISAARGPTASEVAVWLGLGNRQFSSAATYLVGIDPSSLIARDFNGDGILDLATANRVTDDVSILLGIPEAVGTFAPAQSYPVADHARDVIAADITGDGILDLAVASTVGSAVTILIGVGDGTFTSAATVPKPGQGQSSVLADFDGDGNLDLATANETTDSVSIFVGLGDGTLSSGIEYPTGDDPRWIGAGDIDGDQVLDLVTANERGDGISILAGAGDGSFALPRALATGRFADSAQLVDINFDGSLDIVTGHRISDDFTVQINRGNGTFSAPIAFAAGTPVSDVHVADLDGDGTLDVALSGVAADEVQIFYGLPDCNNNGLDDTCETATGLADDVNDNGVPDECDDFPASNDTCTAAEPIVAPFLELRDTASALADGPPGSCNALEAVAMSNDIWFEWTATEECEATWLSNASYDGINVVYEGSDCGALMELDCVRGAGARRITWQATAGSTYFIHHGSADADTGGEVWLSLNCYTPPPLCRYQPFSNLQFPTEEAPGAIVVEDFNADGLLDVATAHDLFSAGSVNILLGVGDGSVRQSLSYPAGDGPRAMAAADLNADGTIDLVTANDSSDSVSVLLGIGDGAFQTTVDYPAGAGTRFLAIADLNDDGILDIASTSTLDNEVAVLLGNGDGTFGTATGYAAGSLPQTLAIGDFNGDGAADLAVANFGDSAVGILFGIGDGSFQASVSLPTVNSPLFVATADLNDDGNLDLAANNNSFGDVFVWLGAGDGSFAAPISHATEQGSLSLTIGDINHDGIPDLATGSAFPSELTLSFGRGDGTFEAARVLTPAGRPVSVAIADLNQDGAADLLTANRAADDISILLGTGNGNFPLPARYPAGSTPYGLASTDINGDGFLDLVTANRFLGEVSTLLGVADGSFLTPQSYSVGSEPQAVAVADLDGNGAPDIVATNRASESVSILLNFSGGMIAPATTYPLPTLSIPEEVAIDDLNADGVPDLIVAESSLVNDGLLVLLGVGDGTFGPAQFFPVGDGTRSVVTADFNADGIPDAATANSATDSIAVLLGTGNGSFTAPLTYAAGDSTHVVRAGDLDGDSVLDLVAANALANDVSVFIGVGDGTFQTAQRYPTAEFPQGLVIDDFTGDDILDVVATTGGSAGVVSVLAGVGNGTLSAPSNFLAPGYVLSDALAEDVNGDGAADLIVTSVFTDEVVVLSQLLDCNDNGFDDACEIAQGIVDDFDGNGVPDECVPPCGQSGVPGDWNNDAVIDGQDFAVFELCLLGPGLPVPDQCSCFDLDQDLDVDIADFAAW